MEYLYIMIITSILFLALYISVIKTEPEPFKNLIENTRATYNKHKRNARNIMQNTTSTITSKINTNMRLAKL